MLKKPKLPNWSTPIRQAYLLELWARYGNQCLHGHTSCPIESHYAYTTIKAETIGQAYKLPCFDSQGNKILDSSGSQKFLELFRPIQSHYREVTHLRLYDFLADSAIEDWKYDDRVIRSKAVKLESKALHSLGECSKPIRGHFNNIAKDIWHSNAPLYHIEGICFDVLRLQSFAKVKLAGSFVHLFVYLGNSLSSLSKNQKRKAIRYNKLFPREIANKVDNIVSLAVRDYLK